VSSAPVQSVLQMAALTRKSISLPGLGNDWEVEPEDLEICRRPDGSEWELGSGASAKVRTHLSLSQRPFAGSPVNMF
jgi:hypothetical protein